MSYTRTFHKTVHIHYSGSVSYPASKSGGTVHYSGSASENVTVNINVDTNSFDSSVDNCNSNVRILTGAVVATEAAQIKQISDSATKIGQTIIQGFFKTVSSEISQQIMELTSRIDAQLIHLQGLAERCVEKKEQMKRDSDRIIARYEKIFEELNKELENRIYAIDENVFKTKRLIDATTDRSTRNDLVSTIAVSGDETGKLQAKIGSSVTKRLALGTINDANSFLTKQNEVDSSIKRSMLNRNTNETSYVPVGFIETESEDRQIDKHVYQCENLPKINENSLIASFQEKEWNSDVNNTIPEELKQYFNSELTNRYSSNDTHTNRIKENIMKMLNANIIKHCNN